MKKLLLLTFSFLFFYCGNSYSADCGDVTVVDCALTSANDEIVIDNDWVDTNGKKVTISSTGSIIVDDHDDDGLIRFREQVSDIEIENNGTLQVGEYDGVGTRSGEHNTITAKDGTATNLTITNNGVIAADGRNAIGLKAAEGNITITNNVGAIISAYQNAGTYGTINLATAGSTTAGNIKITNHGTIQANHTAHGSTNNAKTHSALRLDDISSGNTITVNNTGTIQAVRCCAVDLRDTTASIEIENSGTISAGTHGAIEGGGTTRLTIMNSGTITGTGTINPTSDVDREATIALASGSGATITNTSTGTIESSGNNIGIVWEGYANSTDVFFNATRNGISSLDTNNTLNLTDQMGVQSKPDISYFNGSYYIVYSDLSKISLIEVSEALSIMDAPNSESLIIYPNPVKDKLSIKLSVTNEDKILVTLFDMNGKIVYKNFSNSNGDESFEIDISKIPAGLYSIKVSGVESSAKGVITKL